MIKSKLDYLALTFFVCMVVIMLALATGQRPDDNPVVYFFGALGGICIWIAIPAYLYKIIFIRPKPED